MNNLDDSELAAMMATVPGSKIIQQHQTAYRVALAKRWQIQPGMKILELGCGQGDMTAVLAAAVGETGHVEAYDLAPATYGVPITIGDAQEHLQKSAVGQQITVHLETDVLAASVSYEPRQFDAVVIAHAAWYFASLDQLKDTLTKVSPWVKQIYFAEWDIVPTQTAQIPHQLAVLIQSQYEAFKENSFANIRTLVTRQWMQQTLTELGFKRQVVGNQDSLAMEDGQWEADYVVDEAAVEFTQANLPEKFRQLLLSEVAVLKATPHEHVKALDSFVITATRD